MEFNDDLAQDIALYIMHSEGDDLTTEQQAQEYFEDQYNLGDPPYFTFLEILWHFNSYYAAHGDD